MDSTCNPRTGRALSEDHYFQDTVEREERRGKEQGSRGWEKEKPEIKKKNM